MSAARASGRALLLTMLIFVLNGAAAGCRAQAETQADASAAAPSRLLSVHVGLMRVDEQRIRFPSASADGSVGVAFSDLPVVGLHAELPWGTRRTGPGLDLGTALAWKSDELRVFGSVGGEGGTLAVDVDSSLLLADVSAGLYWRLAAPGRAQLLLAGGPMVAYGRFEADGARSPAVPADFEGAGLTVILRDDGGSDFAFGYYLRVAFDVPVSPTGRVGLGARLSRAELDFADSLGSIDIDATQFYLSFSTRF